MRFLFWVHFPAAGKPGINADYWYPVFQFDLIVRAYDQFWNGRRFRLCSSYTPMLPYR